MGWGMGVLKSYCQSPDRDKAMGAVQGTRERVEPSSSSLPLQHSVSSPVPIEKRDIVSSSRFSSLLHSLHGQE